MSEQQDDTLVGYWRGQPLRSSEFSPQALEAFEHTVKALEDAVGRTTKILETLDRP